MLAFLYCAIVWPHPEYAMEANAPTLRADTNQLGRVLRLATRLVWGLRHVPYEERHRQLNLFSLVGLWADLTIAFKIFKGEVDLKPSDSVPSRGTRAPVSIAARSKPSSTQDRCLFVRVVKCWNRLPASVVLPSSVSIFKKTFGTSMVRNLSCSTFIKILVTFFDTFLYVVIADYLCFLTPKY